MLTSSSHRNRPGSHHQRRDDRERRCRRRGGRARTADHRYRESARAGRGHRRTDDDELHIASGRSNFTVRTHPAGDFPRLPAPSGDAVTLPVEGLAAALGQVTRAASSEDSRPILTGVLMAAEEGGLRLVATDSFRLAVRDLRGSGCWRPGKGVAPVEGAHRAHEAARCGERRCLASTGCP